MNKIVLDKEFQDLTNDNIKVSYTEEQEIFNISNLVIDINCSDELFLCLNKDNMKISIELNIYCDCNIYILCNGSNLKVRYQYNINAGSVNVFKYNQVKDINEMCVVDLNKDNSSIDYLFKSICNSKENYDYVVHHNISNTFSNIINNGVNREGVMNIQISGDIPKNINGCTCNQNNRIINLTNNRCEIRPNLYIDCDDVIANHSALIGQFSDEDIFYLNSRGINTVDATNLLLKGFLLNGVSNKKILHSIEKDIDKYWR